MKSYEKQVKIERRKLALLRAAFLLISVIFALLALVSPIVGAIIALYVADMDLKWRFAGAGISILYLISTFGLYVIFSELSDRFEDKFMIVAVHPCDYTRKYYSEILAEIKMKESETINNEIQ